ncbi:carbamoyl phosphate synthase small subunit [Salicibibacter cibarius]|uniref:Carbamoyl phosphate synthase small chain n=1 Tax=Salicibibacter cibarius TaxID=2743000 RepID=A0A7T6Z542_9BACI|nr:carbamoyl phosphate synthase small subunit [Salicibibacter cibarius]QQK76987.1 carbamoyl phosphate synthase small subunit [Salicibibacter cibarius]
MKGYLVLENGDVFPGQLLGASNARDVHGEAVFFTGMTGYQDVATDPSYRGQIVVFTYPLIGNYGISDGQQEQSGEWQPRALVMGECSADGYHYQSKETLVSRAGGAPILTDVDTRALVKRIRTSGAMGAVITTDPDAVTWENVTPIEEQALVKEVSTQTMETFGAGDTHIVLIDFGHKKAMVDTLCAYGAKVTVVPYNTPLPTIEELEPDGLLLSNGPGNPKQLQEQLPTIKAAIMQYPTFAICLGHQLIALAFGGDTAKLVFGHRGANQPVIDKRTGRVDMTAQNHSYVVDRASLKGTELEVTHVNVNDESIEGLAHGRLPIRSVQYHPEAHPGPSDSQHLFSMFFRMIAKEKEVSVHA